MIKKENKSSADFDKAYQALNTQQREAVDTLDGPVMVVAGPGTGKTQTIALRIANILRSTDTDPGSILALTFTESGARAMRTRLVNLIGVTAYYCNISTFHSFCTMLMKDHPDTFTINASVDPLSDLEKLKIIYHLIDITRLTLLRPIGAPRHYARSILSAISNLKREGVDPSELTKLLDLEEQFLNSDDGKDLKKTESSKRWKNIQKNRELHTLYVAYQTDLKKSERFDFEDMIGGVVEALKNDEDLLRSIQERFHYFLVDEYQDTNSAQNELLMLLASFWGEGANIFVSGDPDQSIMRFQGASIENQLFFVKQFPKAKIVTLKENYRSTQTILDAANNLISHNNLRISDVVQITDPHLHSQRGAGESIGLVEVSSGTAETIFLAEDIKKKIKSGVSPSDIAIIYRKNDEAHVIVNTLIKYGLDYTVQGGANILEDSTVRNFLKILRVLGEMRRRQEDENLFTILHYDIFGINPLDVLKISRLAYEKRLTLFDILASPKLLDSLTLSSRDNLDTCFFRLGEWQQLDANVTFSEFFETVLNKSGYLTWVLKQSDAHHRLARLNTLFDEVKRMNRFDHKLGLAGFLENLDLMEENRLRIDESDFGKSHNAITLTTAHSSKGLEWGHVYLYHASDGVWGNNKIRDLISLPEGLIKNVKLSEKEKNEDERRLFYVAMTRAKSSLTITRGDSYSSYGSVRQSIPTMFLSELGNVRLYKIDVSGIEEESHHHIEKLLTLPTVNNSKNETDFLLSLVEKFKLPVTSLNTYLLCAYLFKLDKLLKVPHAKKPHLAFGTAVHYALESFYSQLGDSGVVPSKEFLLSKFASALEKEVISTKDLKTRSKQGQKILSAYYDYHKDDFHPPLFLEKNLEAHLDEITLTGKIDRIEWFSKAEKLIRVIDYKTGKSKTMGQINGDMAGSGGDLKRQLVFYKILIELDQRLQNIKFGEAMLDFIEEASVKGKDGRRRLTITDQEVEDLKKVIREVMAEIRALHFPRTTNLKTCTTCAFKDHCWPNGIPTS